MNKTLCRLALLALPTLLAASCGVDELLKLDGGSGADLAGACPAGVTPFQIQTGQYMTMNASNLSESCMLGLTTADVSDNRTVQNDAMGNITLLAADGSTILGVGPVSCNVGSLVQNQGITLASGPCTYRQTSTVAMTVTSANTFNITVNLNRMYMNTAGMTCTKPANCTISFSATMKK